jgi:hypoxanthine-guanine phosphoribosyltransferase
MSLHQPADQSDENLYVDLNHGNNKVFNFMSKTRYLDQDDLKEHVKNVFPIDQKLETRVVIATTDLNHQGMEQLNLNVLISLLKVQGVTYNSSVTLLT